MADLKDSPLAQEYRNALYGDPNKGLTAGDLLGAQARQIPQEAPVTGYAPQIEPSNPTYDFYNEAWTETQNTMERLGQAHKDGFAGIGQHLKGAAVLTGQLSYEDFLADEKEVLNAQNLRKNENLAKRYLPYVTDMMIPLAEALPSVEVAMASIGTGIGVGVATTPVAGPVGALFGGAVPWATQAVLAAGDQYIKMRRKNISHEVARNIAVPGGMATGYVYQANVQAWSNAFTNSFQQATKAHLKPSVLNPVVSRYLHLAGVGGVTAAAAKSIENSEQVIANSFSKGVHSAVDFSENLAETVASGALTNLVGGVVFDKSGQLVGNLAKAATQIVQAVEKFVAQRARPAFTGSPIFTNVSQAVKNVVLAALRGSVAAPPKTAVAVVPPLVIQPSDIPPPKTAKKSDFMAMQRVKQDAEQQAEQEAKQQAEREAELDKLMELLDAAMKDVDFKFQLHSGETFPGAISEVLQKDLNMSKDAANYTVNLIFRFLKSEKTAEDKTDLFKNLRSSFTAAGKAAGAPPPAAKAAPPPAAKAAPPPAAKATPPPAAKATPPPAAKATPPPAAKATPPPSPPPPAKPPVTPSPSPAIVAARRLRVQTADATQREVDGLAKLTKAVKDAEDELSKLVPGTYDRKKLTLLQMELDLRKAELAMFRAEERLRDINVVGADRWEARQQLADAKADLIDVGAKGMGEQQLIPSTLINLVEAFGKPFHQGTRGWTAPNRSYEMKYRLIVQLHPEADRLASNFSLAKPREQYEKLQLHLDNMYIKIFTARFQKNRFSKQWGEIQARIVEAQHKEVSFEHKELANKNHKGEYRGGVYQKWKGTEAELVKAYNQVFHDVDSHNGLTVGNGFDLHPKHLDSFAAKVKEKVEGNPDLITLADASREFLGYRGPLVGAYNYGETGLHSVLPVGYSGEIKRFGAKDLDLDPYTQKGVNAWLSSTFGVGVKGPKPGMTLARKPESTLPILKSDQFADITNSNRQLASFMAYRDHAPVHRLLLEHGTVVKRAEQVTGSTGVIELTKQHLKDITVGIPRAQTFVEKLIMSSSQAMYTIQLTGDVLQYPKQLSSLPNVFAHINKTDSFIIAQESYNRNPAVINAMFSRSISTKSRYRDFGNTMVGVEYAKNQRDPNWFQSLMALPLVSSDKSASVLTGYTAYVDLRRQGMSHTKALDHANKVLNIVNSTGQIDMLPALNRAPNISSTLSTFMVQPQLGMSRIKDLNSDLINFGFGQAGKPRAVKAWRDAFAGNVGLKLGTAMYAGIGVAAAIALNPSEDAKEKVSNWAAQVTASGYFDFPGVNDLAHHAFVTGTNLVFNVKTRAWEFKSVPLAIAKENGLFFYDMMKILTDPETSITYADALGHYASGPNAVRFPGEAGRIQSWATLGLTGGNIPGKAISFAAKQMKKAEKDQ